MIPPVSLSVATATSMALQAYFILRKKISPNQARRALMKNPRYETSTLLRAEILKSVKPYSEIWHDTLDEITIAKSKKLIRLITKKDMKSFIEKDLIEQFLAIRKWGVSDFGHINVVMTQIEHIITACDITASNEEELLCTINNLFVLMKCLARLEKGHFLPHYYKPQKNIFLKIREVVGNVLKNTMAEDFKHKRESIKIVQVHITPGRKHYKEVWQGNNFLCKLSYLPRTSSKELTDLYYGTILPEIVTAGLRRIEMKEREVRLSNSAPKKAFALE